MRKYGEQRISMLEVMSQIMNRYFIMASANRICSQYMSRSLDKSAYENNFLISQPKHMLWVLKGTVLRGRFF